MVRGSTAGLGRGVKLEQEFRKANDIGVGEGLGGPVKEVAWETG